MKNLSFEQAFERLEEILQKMNEGKASLDSSLELFEEADKLIKECSSKLTSAEKKIEILIKQRNGSVEIENDKPKLENFSPDNQKIFDN